MGEEKEFQEYLNSLIIVDKDDNPYDATQNRSKKDLRCAVFKYGQSKIFILNDMLEDVDRYLFEGFCYSLTAPPFHWHYDENGNVLKLDEIITDYTLDDCMKDLKNFPHFQTLSEDEQDDKIKLVKNCHEDRLLNKDSVHCEYHLKYRDLKKIRPLIIEEIEQLTNRPRSFDNNCDIPNEATADAYLENTASTITSGNPDMSNSTDFIRKGKLYNFDIQKISNIYHFCIEAEIIDDSITEVFFLNAVENTDFKKIYANAENKNAKGACARVISITSKYVKPRDTWYKKTAQSIDTEPTKCSGRSFNTKQQKLAKQKGLL